MPDGVGEGWWIPPATLEAHPELTTAEAILARPDLFPHPEDASKGAFVGCPAGWGCQLINAQQYIGWDMEAKGWLLVDPGSAAGLDGSMAKAVERGCNIISSSGSWTWVNRCRGFTSGP
jgi:glycine betaine/proline transport system substrate-binding protein